MTSSPAQFLTTVYIEPWSDPAYPARRWRTTAPLRYRDRSGAFWEVPSRFPIDLATIPIWARWLFPPNGPYKAQAILHDYLRRILVMQDHGMSKAVADRLFYEALGVGYVEMVNGKAITVPPIARWKAWAMYQFVKRWQ